MQTPSAPSAKMRAPSGLRQFSLCQNQQIFLAQIYDTVRIYSNKTQSIISMIKLQTSARSAKLSPCGKYFYIHDAANVISIYDVFTCTLLQIITDAPVSTKTIKFSKNQQKIIYGSTQVLCVWNINNYETEVMTNHWKNINVYDINENGIQFGLGTYNGIIYVLDYLQIGKFNQIQIKRHKGCVACLCFHKNSIISASHDGYLLISTIQTKVVGQKMISYNEMKVKSIPKQIQSVGDYFYMYNNEGMSWLNSSNVLNGFTDRKVYKALADQNGTVYFVSMYSGEMQWWPASVFKTKEQIQKERAEKIKKEMNSEKGRQIWRGLDGKENRVVYRVRYNQ